MKKITTWVLYIVAAFCMLTGIVTASPIVCAQETSADTGNTEAARDWDAYLVLDRGFCGKNANHRVYYTLYQTGQDQYCLRIYGKGSTFDCKPASPCWPILHPWDSETVSDLADRNDMNISEIVVEEGVTRLGTRIFAQLKNPGLVVSLPSTLKEIGPHAFYGAGMKELTLPDTVQTIGKNAFDSCTNLKTIRIGAKLKKIDKTAFGTWNKLSTVIEVPKNRNKEYKKLFKPVLSKQKKLKWKTY